MSKVRELQRKAEASTSLKHAILSIRCRGRTWWDIPAIDRGAVPEVEKGMKSKKADSLFSHRPSHPNFRRPISGTGCSNAVVKRFGNRGPTRVSALIPRHIRCKETPHCPSMILIAESPDGLCCLSSLEDCSSVDKNNSTGETADECCITAAYFVEITGENVEISAMV